MSRITPPGQVPEKLQKIFDEIKGVFGMVPNVFKTYAHYPPLLEANWNKVKAVMMQGTLSRKTKETIALLVSKDNACQYCIAAHTAALKSIGVNDDEIRQIEENIEKADFTAKEKALINFARKANKNPLGISDSDFNALLLAGASEAEIVEALGVMEVFTSFNKFIDSLHIAIDF